MRHFLLFLLSLLIPLHAATAVTLDPPDVIDGCDSTAITVHVAIDSSPATAGNVSLLIAGNVYATAAVDANGDAAFEVSVPTLVGTSTWVAALYHGGTSQPPALSSTHPVLVDRIAAFSPLSARVYAPLDGQTLIFTTQCIYAHARSVVITCAHPGFVSSTDNEDGTATVSIDPDVADVGETMTFQGVVTDLVHGGFRTASFPLVIHATPVGEDDEFDAFKNTPLEVDPSEGVLANDIGDDIFVDDVVQPDHGSVTYSAAGGFTYTPDTNWTGVDSFTYHLTDSFGFDAGTVTVTVTVSEIGG